jgi:hypothetical protein
MSSRDLLEVLCRISEALKVPPEELFELAKADFLEKTQLDLSKKHAEALRLFRRDK